MLILWQDQVAAEAHAEAVASAVVHSVADHMVEAASVADPLVVHTAAVSVVHIMAVLLADITVDISEDIITIITDRTSVDPDAALM